MRISVNVNMIYNDFQLTLDNAEFHTRESCHNKGQLNWYHTSKGQLTDLAKKARLRCAAPERMMHGAVRICHVIHNPLN